MSWALSKEAFSHGGHISQESKPTARHHPAPGRRPREAHPSSRPAHLRENGGLIGRLVLLLLLGSSFLHLFPVSLLFPVSSLWLQVQSTGVQLVQVGRGNCQKKTQGSATVPRSAPHLSPGPRNPGRISGQDSTSLTSWASSTRSSYWSPSPSSPEGTHSLLWGPATQLLKWKCLEIISTRPLAHGQNPWEPRQITMHSLG